MLFYPKLRLRTSKAVEHQRPALHPLISDLLKWTSCFLPRYKTEPLASAPTSLDDLKEAAVSRISEAEEGREDAHFEKSQRDDRACWSEAACWVSSAEGLLSLRGVILMSHDQFFSWNVWHVCVRKCVCVCVHSNRLKYKHTHTYTLVCYITLHNSWPGCDRLSWEVSLDEVCDCVISTELHSRCLVCHQ